MTCDLARLDFFKLKAFDLMRLDFLPNKKALIKVNS